MELKGRITFISEQVTGVSKTGGTPYSLRNIHVQVGVCHKSRFDTASGLPVDEPDIIALKVFGNDAESVASSYRIGDAVLLDINFYAGRFGTEVRIPRTRPFMSPLQPTASQQQPPYPTSQAVPQQPPYPMQQAVPQQPPYPMQQAVPQQPPYPVAPSSPQAAAQVAPYRNNHVDRGDDLPF